MGKKLAVFSGNAGLWVTDGTASGTSELSVAGAASGGLFANVTPDFTVLGGKVLFDGQSGPSSYGLGHRRHRGRYHRVECRGNLRG